mgnify:CR=1 FL=1
MPVVRAVLAESGEGGDDDDDALLGQGLRGGLAGLAGDNGGSAGAPLGLGDGDRSGARPGPSPGTPSSSSGSGSRDSRGNRTVMDLVSDAEAEVRATMRLPVLLHQQSMLPRLNVLGPSVPLRRWRQQLVLRRCTRALAATMGSWTSRTTSK